MGKPLELLVIRVIGVEVKEVSDQPVIASTGRKTVCSFAGLRNWSSGYFEGGFWARFPPDACEMAWTREAGAVSPLPGRIKGETIVSKGSQFGSKPRPGSYSSALLKPIPPATSTLPEGSNVAV